MWVLGAAVALATAVGIACSDTASVGQPAASDGGSETSVGDGDVAPDAATDVAVIVDAQSDAADANELDAWMPGWCGQASNATEDQCQIVAQATALECPSAAQAWRYLCHNHKTDGGRPPIAGCAFIGNNVSDPPSANWACPAGCVLFNADGYCPIGERSVFCPKHADGGPAADPGAGCVQTISAPEWQNGYCCQ